MNINLIKLILKIVWKSTKALGMSFSINPTKDEFGFYHLYVVAEYDPPGNYISEMIKNVLPPKIELPKITEPPKVTDTTKETELPNVTNTPKEIESKETEPPNVTNTPKETKSSKKPSTVIDTKITEECMKAFRDTGLEVHNVLREKHSVPPLKIGQRATQFSLKHATFLSNDFIFEHSEQSAENENLGENIYLEISSEPFKLNIDNCRCNYNLILIF